MSDDGSGNVLDEGAATDEAMVGGVRIAEPDPAARKRMAAMIEALPDEMRQTMVSLRRDGGDRRYAVEMEDGLDRVELTGPIANALAGALGRMGLGHDGVAVGRSTRIGPS